MIIFPAIDLLDGHVVRLQEGDYDKVTVYGDDPLDVARSFKAAGATHLHMVDLDGARHGTQQNFPAIEKVVREGGLYTQVGGGGRDEASVRRYMELGVDRMILGTMAVREPQLMAELARAYPGRIAAGVDARDGKVAIHGWREVTDIDALAFMKALPSHGVHTAIYTDISRDGMLEGANIEAYRALSQIDGLNVVASGGVTNEEDIVSLSRLGLYGAIIGKALYAGRLTLGRAIALAKEAQP